MEDFLCDLFVGLVFKEVDCFFSIEQHRIDQHADDNCALARLRTHFVFKADDGTIDERDKQIFADLDLHTHAAKISQNFFVFLEPFAGISRAERDFQPRLPGHVDVLLDLDGLHHVQLCALRRCVIEKKPVVDGRHLFLWHQYRLDWRRGRVADVGLSQQPRLDLRIGICDVPEFGPVLVLAQRDDIQPIVGFEQSWDSRRRGQQAWLKRDKIAPVPILYDHGGLIEVARIFEKHF